ncbi:MAG: AMP-binding protein [Chloroflexota bacterium]
MILDEVLSRNARRYPDKPGLVCEPHRFTFREFNDRVNRLVNGLSALGLSKGDRIAIVADSGHQHIELGFAAIKGGIALAPLNPALPPRDLAHLMNNARARAVVLGENYKGLVESLQPELKGVERFVILGSPQDAGLGYEDLIASHPATEPRVQLREDDVLFLVCSGGTTGLPKQIAHTYRSCLATMLNVFYVYGVKHDDVCVFATPPFWGQMIPWLICPHYYMGCTVVVLRNLTPQSLLETIQREKVTTGFLGSPFLPILLSYPDIHSYDFSSLRLVMSAGAPLPAEVWKQAKETFGDAIATVYGQSEMSPMTYLPPQEMTVTGSPEQVKRSRSVGREVLNVEVRVVNERGEDVPPGEVGEIIARGDSMMAGYWNNPQATERTIRGGYLYTGDMATRDAEGYVYLVGRQKDVINVGGKVLSPTEIEDIVYQHPAVQEAAAIGVPHPELGESVKVVVVLKQGKKATAEEVIALCRRYLPGIAVPQSVEFVSEFPKSPVGKVLKHKLRERYATG